MSHHPSLVRQSSHVSPAEMPDVRQTLLALSLRLSLAMSSMASRITTRAEVASPVHSLDRIREALFLMGQGKSPYEGWSYHGAPLLLPLLSYTSPRDTFCTVPFVLADLLAAWILTHVQKRLSTTVSLSSVYLLNPFTIMSSVGCCVGSIENLLVILSVYGALSHRIILAACALSGAIYIGLHPILFALPIMLMVTQKSRKQWYDGVAFMAWLCFSLMGLSILSHAYLNQFPDHRMDAWIPLISDVTSHDHNILTPVYEDISPHGRHWMTESYGFILKATDLTPNLGLWWYFFTEMFPFYRPFFLVVFHSASAIFLIPFCIVYSRSPLFIIMLQAMTHAIFKPYPTVADYALITVLLFSHQGVLETVEWWWFMIVTGSLLCVLEPAMWYEWVQTESANANFYFSINLLIATWLIVLMALLIHAKDKFHEKDKQE